MNILLVYPEFPDTFWSFKHALRFIRKKAGSPPLGLLTVAAMLPATWEKRLVDLNVTGPQQVEHSLDQPWRGEDFAVVGDALSGLDVVCGLGHFRLCFLWSLRTDGKAEPQRRVGGATTLDSPSTKVKQPRYNERRRRCRLQRMLGAIEVNDPSALSRKPVLHQMLRQLWDASVPRVRPAVNYLERYQTRDRDPPA